MKNKSVMKSITFTIVCLLFGVIIALQLKSINSNSYLALAENLRVDELSQQVMDLMQKNGELVDKIDKLTAAQRAMEKGTAGQEEQLRAIIDERDHAEIFAGLTDVTGPGGIITISPAKDRAVRDSDLRTFVNMLRATGAQAISINGQRLVAMSEIATAGSTIVINGQRFLSSEQFEIVVIIDSSGLSNAQSFLQPQVASMKQSAIETVFAVMDRVTIKKLPEDSPAYRLELLQPNT